MDKLSVILNTPFIPKYSVVLKKPGIFNVKNAEQEAEER